MHVRNQQKLRVISRKRRARRVRQKVHGTAARPRLSVFRSARHIVAQLIDDELGRTLAYASDAEIRFSPEFTAGKKAPVPAGMSAKVARAHATGRLLAERAATAKITSAVFDRGGYRYHGRVAAVAEGARSAGLAV